MRPALPLVTALGLAAVPALASNAPSFDCAAAQGQAEIMICNDADLSRLDRHVASRYAAAQDMAAQAPDTDTAENRLRAEQRGWIKGRDDCWKAADPRACIEKAYLTREGALVAGWLLQNPRMTATWVCNDSPANTVVTMFFDTELPSLRFERGDSVDTGSLVPTASGARYEGTAGRSIWIKGDVATYREPDPDGTTLECARAQ